MATHVCSNCWLSDVYHILIDFKVAVKQKVWLLIVCHCTVAVSFISLVWKPYWIVCKCCSSLSQKDYCQVINGYAEAGPQSTEVANLDHPQGEEGAAAVPNYAVVVKSKKKDKKKEKKGAEMNPCEDEYAVVDKSKKKTKKNEPDATYAEVDLLKKSKKVCWPLLVFLAVYLLS